METLTMQNDMPVSTQAKPKKKIKKTGLNYRKRCFCLEYMLDFNASQAAIRAGYSPRFAARTGYRLLHSREIKRELAKMQKKLEYEMQVEAGMVLEEALLIMKNATDDNTRLKAMALILKHLGSFRQVQQSVAPWPTLHWEVAGEENTDR